MLHTVDFYYYSPTGGTKKVGEILANALAEKTIFHDMAQKETVAAESEIAIIAVPVFGGRILAAAAEKIRKLEGAGKKVITLVVYGVRAYDDALLELNDLAKEREFHILAAGAFAAQHSIVPEVGAGRPDGKDALELHTFAKNILEKLETGKESEIAVPGNCPYKADFKPVTTPFSTEDCNLCGRCVSLCSYDAIQMEREVLITDPAKCGFCMACVRGCTRSARILPTPVQERMNHMLMPLKDVRRENEMYL